MQKNLQRYILQQMCLSTLRLRIISYHYMEALACGTQVITYSTGGSPGAIDENTGIEVERGNEEDFVKAIKRYLVYAVI